MFLIDWKSNDEVYFETKPCAFTTMEKAKDYLASLLFWVKEWNWKDDEDGDTSAVKADDAEFHIHKVELDPEAK